MGPEKAAGPRLCSLYLRDVARLLPRTQIERLRIASHHCNTTIMSISAREMPLFAYPSFEITTVSNYALASSSRPSYLYIHLSGTFAETPSRLRRIPPRQDQRRGAMAEALPIQALLQPS